MQHGATVRLDPDQGAGRRVRKSANRLGLRHIKAVARPARHGAA
jgi:hypothetical protein